MENTENEFGYGVTETKTLIDPASGWKYGFPMVYEPSHMWGSIFEGFTLAETVSV